ncbi:MAG TPA: hypothetical protein DGH68_12215, partial [Bacteroidetes bacterium]|nr:hypothetical protein [Bacteroidota bacterium]
MMSSISSAQLPKSIRRNVALRICIVYAIISAMWILLSDKLVFSLVAEPGDMALLSMVKGIVFVLATSAIIYVLVSRGLRAVGQSEQRYRHVVQRSQIGIFHYDMEWNITDCNTRLVEILQSARERLIGFNLQNLQDRSILPALEKAIEGEEGAFEGFYSATTGPARLWILLRTAPLFDEQERVKGGVAIIEDISERKWAEQALRNAERQYREIFEHAGEGIYQSTPDGRFIAANPALAQMLGYASADELIGSITDIERQVYVNQEERLLFRRSLEEHGSIKGFLSQLHRKDGTTIWVSENARVVRNGSPQIRYYEGAVQDITERKHAEEALSESEERYRSLVEMSPDAIAVHSEGRLVYANAAAAQLLGAGTPEELVGKPILSFVHPEYHETVRQRVESVGSEGVAAPLIEEKFIRLDGTVIDVEVVAIPFTFRGKPAVQVVIRDITPRNQAEREIRLLAQTVASTKDCVSITDLEDRTLFVNDAFVETYGFTREDLIGKPISIIRSPANAEELASQIRPATLAGGWYGEVVNRRKDGSNFPVELWTSVVRNEIDEPVAMVGVARDITERKRAEGSMQKLLRAIEQSDEVIFMTERDGTITYINPAFEKVYGFKREEAIGKTPRILKGGTLSEAVYRDFWALLLAGKSVRGDIVNRTKPGKLITVKSSISPIHDGEGSVTGFIAVQDDITDRKKAEEERKTLESQLFQAQKMESIGTLAGGIA